MGQKKPTQKSTKVQKPAPKSAKKKALTLQQQADLTKDGFSGQEYFPDEIGHRTFYQPMERGFEREIQKRIDYWNALRKKKK